MITFVFYTHLTAQIKIGNKTLNVGNKISSVKLLDDKKAETGHIDYYLIKGDSNTFISSEIQYDLKKNMLLFYQYHFSIATINPDTTHISIKETIMGSHLANYFAVNVYAKQDSSFIYYSYENTDEEQKPTAQSSGDYRFIFNSDKEAKQWANYLNDYYRPQLRIKEE